MPALGGQFQDKMMFVFCDASVHSAHNVQDPAVLRAFITPNGGETVDIDKLQPAK